METKQSAKAATPSNPAKSAAKGKETPTKKTEYSDWAAI